MVQLKLIGNSRIKGIAGGYDWFTLYKEILVDESEEMSNSQETFQGKQVQFKYSLRYRIGQGSYGTVWNGVDPNGNEIAIKKMQIIDDEMVMKQLNDELYANEELQHENIGKIRVECFWVKI